MLSYIKNRVMKQSRDKKIEHFYTLCQEEKAVLDVGVEGYTEEPSTTNSFLKTFRYDGKYYTGLGIEDLSEIARLHRDKRIVEYPGGKFPFSNKEFDFVFSNAVIEHVGDESAQLQFLNEMLRVGNTVFFTTPNKYFPVESHTNALFIHWSDGLFYRWCNNNQPYWNKDNLKLFSRSTLINLVKKSNTVSWTLKANRLFGITMTFTIVCSSNG